MLKTIFHCCYCLGIKLKQNYLNKSVEMKLNNTFLSYKIIRFYFIQGQICFVAMRHHQLSATCPLYVLLFFSKMKYLRIELFVQKKFHCSCIKGIPSTIQYSRFSLFIYFGANIAGVVRYACKCSNVKILNILKQAGCLVDSQDRPDPGRGFISL